MILVTLKNEVKEKKAALAGVYVMSQEGKTNGKNAWLKGKAAIWYHSENECWMIGPKNYIGTGKSGIHSTIDAQNPTLVGNNWQYYRKDKFVVANPGDIIIFNIEGK